MKSKRYYYQVSSLKKIIIVFYMVVLSACSSQNSSIPVFPPPRVDIYVLDTSISSVKNKENSTLKLYDRVENKILKEISENALGSPELIIDGEILKGRSPVGFYLLQLTNRASENEIFQIKDLQGSSEIWAKITSQSYGLNETNLLSLWNKLQLISSEIKDYKGSCEKKVFEDLFGESVNESEKSALATMLCLQTVGSIDKLNLFRQNIETFISRTGGSPGSDIYGMLISINQWIETIEAKNVTNTKFNLIILSDMVHDADSEEDLNSLLRNVDIVEAQNIGEEKAKELNIRLTSNVDVYVVGIGAFGQNYETQAKFIQILTSYWKGFFGANNRVFFTPSLDDVNLA